MLGHFNQRSDDMFSANFFSGAAGTRNNSFSGMGLMGSFSYSDYASIRNGSYHKLLSSYYSLDSGDSGSTGSGSRTSTSSSSSRTYNYWTKDGMVQRTYDNRLVTSGAEKTSQAGEAKKVNTSISKEPASKLATIESDAEKLSDAADALLAQGSKSVFKQVTKTGTDGKKTTGYDTDAIYKAVSSYVENYNKVIKSAGDSKVMAIRTSAASMSDYTKANAKALSDIGIKVGADRTLSLDKEAFQDADMSKVKSLFQGSGSYGYQVSVKASAIDYHAQYEASKASTYNSVGTYAYNYSSGSLWNSMV